MRGWSRQRRRLRWRFARWLCALLLWHGPASAQSVLISRGPDLSETTISAVRERPGASTFTIERPRIRGGASA